MESNQVTVNLVSSKEYIPIWTITSQILEGVLEEVMKRIAKKKPPPKKVKIEVIKKPASKIIEEGIMIFFI